MRRAVLVMLCGLLAASGAAGQQLAFETAEGFGRFSKGGRGGKAYLINSLNGGVGTGGTCNAGGCSGGTITLRDCLYDRLGVGARTCVFRLGGTINTGRLHPGLLSNADPPPFLTIAGQTAPGQGIMVKGELYFRDTHDILIRHLRVRPGASPISPGDSRAVNLWQNAYDIIVDHSSFGWATDDIVSTTTSPTAGTGITWQWNIFSEGLTQHYGASLGVIQYGTTAANVSYLHNLHTHMNDRAPVLGGGNVQVVNSVMYNVYGGAYHVVPTYNTVRIWADYVNNYFQQNGPDTQNPNQFNRIRNIACGWPNYLTCGENPAVDAAGAASQIYLHGNYHSLLRTNPADSNETAMLVQGGVGMPTSTTVPHAFPVIPSQTTAVQARVDVLAKAGATVPVRDSIDTRQVNDVNNLTGEYPVTEADVGGYPTYASSTPYTDSDSDGISDTWETAHGLNPANAADGPALAAGQPAGGYTNLELFLNELAGDTPTTPTEPDITSNLVAYYPFDGTVNDSATADGAQNGTLMNGASYTSHAKGGRAVQLDGTSQFVQVADAAVLDVTDYTLAAWVYPTASITTWKVVVAKDHVYYLYAGSQDTCGAGGVFAGHEPDNWACHGTPLTPNVWTHLAVTHDGATVRLYRNGVEVDAATSTADPAATTGVLYIGRSQFGDYFPGRLDEVRLYSRALSALDVEALHALTFLKGRRPKGQGGGTR